MDRIEDRVDFNYIRYSNCWEDADILCAALNPSPGKQILSIASSGDNSLALLAGGAEVLAVDLNQSQLACVELRRSAISALEYEECLAFLGVREDSNRLKIYDRLKSGISPGARNFWDSNAPIVKNGIIHSGKFERYFSLFRKRVMPFIHSGATVKELLMEKKREERIIFYRDRWANLRWRLLFKMFFSRFVMARMGRDTEFFKYVDGAVSTRILKRTEYALTELPTHGNPYLDYILTGNFTNSLPFYLRKENYIKIKGNIGNISFFKGPAQLAANSSGRKFDGFNLSDIFEYLDGKTCEDIYGILLDNSNRRARFAYWNMLVPRSCPEKFRDKISCLDELSKKLFGRDKAFFYSRFIVEEVR
jgi:S-adenosylmethionine-diacylglycerol 3-amino-3-carboxypropyl transferase